MLDLHACSSGGSKDTLAAVSTILLGNDGQTAAGVPIDPSATLVAWGGMTTIADTIEKLQLLSQDQIDPVNGAQFLPGAASVLGIVNQYDNLPFKTGARSILLAQNTGAANDMVYWIDSYPGGKIPAQTVPRYGRPASNSMYSTTFSALTAITWGSAAFAPTQLPPAGKYAILGARVTGLTNYGLLRFTHADFGAYSPGFPVVDSSKAAARAVVNDDPLLQTANGFQFSYLSEILKIPCNPVFTISAQGTGLLIEAAAITADTPIVNLVISKVG